MNRQWVLFHLREASSELAATIREFEDDPEYGLGEFSVGMAHLYHHLNTAWNSRDASGAEVEESSEEAFHAWRRFPDDLPL